MLCKECNNQERCSLCKKNSILTNLFKCKCRDGFYQKENKCFKKKCTKKINSCKNCKDKKCLKCKKNSNLNQKGDCKCIKGFYYNEKKDQCIQKECTKKFKLCKKCAENKCKKCKKNAIFYDLKGKCFCKKGYKYKYKTDECKSKRII